MTRTAYTTRTGAKQYRPTVTETEAYEDTLGFCLACGTEATSVEPDARKLTCGSCNRAKVYSLEELAYMGLLTVRPGPTRRATRRVARGAGLHTLITLP